jgi:hypothetical protein
MTSYHANRLNFGFQPCPKVARERLIVSTRAGLFMAGYRSAEIRFAEPPS